METAIGAGSSTSAAGNAYEVLWGQISCQESLAVVDLGTYFKTKS